MIALLCLLCGVLLADGRLTWRAAAAFVGLLCLASFSGCLWLMLNAAGGMPLSVCLVYSAAFAALLLGTSLLTVSAGRQARLMFRDRSRLAAFSSGLAALLLQLSVTLLFLSVALHYAGCYEGRGC